MKIAVPAKGNLVDEHFGHCEAYRIYTIDTSNAVNKIELLPSPQGCGCKSNIAGLLQQLGVTVMLAGNMGLGALNVLNNSGIKVYRGCSGDVNAVVNDFLMGRVADSNVSCTHHGHHGEGHDCKNG